MTDKSTLLSEAQREAIEALGIEVVSKRPQTDDLAMVTLGTLAKLASPSPPPSAGVDAVAVKALEWREFEGVWNARPTSGPRYTVRRFYDAWDLLIDDHYAKPYVHGWRDTYQLDEAKAAAQADYEARIRSALTLAKPASEPADGGVREKCASIVDAAAEVARSQADECRAEHPERAERYAASAIALDEAAGMIRALSAPASSSPDKPDPAVQAVREALETAVDAMQLYMLPSAMDGGIGECAAITNTKHALEKARAALAPAAQAIASHEPASGETQAGLSITTETQAAQAGTVAQEGRDNG